MPGNSKTRSLGASVLLGIAAGTVSLSGCAILGEASDNAEISAEEQQLFQAAVTQNDPSLVERYLQRFPANRVRSVLAAQPPEVLGRLSPAAFSAVSASTLQQLPRSVQLSLPPEIVSQITAGERPRNADRAEDTYSG